MGYANSSQIGAGLRQRLYSRAFIIGSITNPQNRFVYLVLDTQSGDTAVRYGILSAVASLGPEYSMYGWKNIAVTGTHSHSGPGAWLNYLLPQITSLGFDKQSYQAIVDGATLSIKRAHESLTPGYLTFGSGELEDANINRSPYAYLANPEAERAKYATDVDKTMTLLRFRRALDRTDMGVLTWFPVHGTSLLGNNTIIAADNKGVASRLFEQRVGGSFVAGFSQSNVGDSSPNVNGAWCEDDGGLPCNFEDSTCNGRSQPCHGQGPFNAQFDNGAKSCFEIGRRQFRAALGIYVSVGNSRESFFVLKTGVELVGLYRHAY
jgi:neutral ceramidase